MVTVAPELDVESDRPPPSAAIPEFTCMSDEVFFVVGDTLNETLATTPLEIDVAFSPHKTQVGAPATLLQAIPLFTPETAGLAEIVALEKSVEE